MRRFVCVSLLILFSSSLSLGKWAMVPLDELVAEADLIVVGKLYSANENDDGIGNGLIRIDEIVAGNANASDARSLRVGDSLKIKWADNWACASGMHMRRVGKLGVWLLDVSRDGTVSAAYPGKFMPVENLGEIRQLLRRDKAKQNVNVDVPAVELEQGSIPVIRDEIIVADVDPPIVDSAYYPGRAAIVLIFAAVLNLLLYRNRFGIK